MLKKRFLSKIAGLVFMTLALILTIGSGNNNAQAISCTPTASDLANGINYAGCEDGTTMPTFNRYLDYPYDSNSDGVIDGTFDETDFFKVYNENGNVNSYTNSALVEENDRLTFFVRLHNDCNPELNGRGDGQCVAEQVRLLINSFNQVDDNGTTVYETNPFVSRAIRASISAGNTTPETVTDNVSITSENREPVVLEYVEGTAYYELGEVNSDRTYTLYPRQLFGYNGTNPGSPITSVAGEHNLTSPFGKFYGSLDYTVFAYFDVIVKTPPVKLTQCESFNMTPNTFGFGQTLFTLETLPEDYPAEDIAWIQTRNGVRVLNPDVTINSSRRQAVFHNLGFGDVITVVSRGEADAGDCYDVARFSIPVPEPGDDTPVDDFEVLCREFSLTPTQFTPGEEATFDLTVTPSDFNRDHIRWEAELPGGEDQSINFDIEDTSTGQRVTVDGLTERHRIYVSTTQDAAVDSFSRCNALATPITEPEITPCEDLALTPESKTFEVGQDVRNEFNIGTLVPDDFDGEIVWEIVGPSSGNTIYRSQDNRTVEIYDLTENDVVQVSAIPTNGTASCKDFSVPEEPEIKICTELALTESSKTFTPIPTTQNRFTVGTLLPEDFNGEITWEVVPSDPNNAEAQLEANSAIITTQNNGRSALITGLTENLEVVVSASPDESGNCQDRAVPEEITLAICRDLALTRGSKTFTPEPTAENSFAINIDPSDFPAEQIEWYTEPALPAENFTLSADRRAAVITGLTTDHIVYVTATPIEEGSSCLDFAVPEDIPLGVCEDLDIFNINVDTDNRIALFDFETLPPEFLDEVVLQVISGPNTGVVEDLGGMTGRLRYFSSEATVAAYVPGQFDFDLESGTYNGCYDQFTIKDEVPETPVCENLDLYPDSFIPEQQCTDFLVSTEPGTYSDYTIEPAQNVVSQNGNRYTLCGLTDNDVVRARATGDVSNNAKCEDEALPAPPPALICSDAFLTPRSFAIKPGQVNTFDLNVLPGNYDGAFRWYTSPSGIGEFNDGSQTGGSITTTARRVTFRQTVEGLTNARIYVEAVDPRYTQACSDLAQGSLTAPDEPSKLGKTEVEGKLFVVDGERVTYRISFEPNNYMNNQDLKLIDTASIFSGRIPGQIDGNPSRYGSEIIIDPASIRVDGISRCFPNQPQENCYTGDFLNPEGLTLHKYQGRRITITYSGTVKSGLTAEACRNLTFGSDKFCGEHFPNTVSVVVPEPVTPTNPNPNTTYTITDSYQVSVLCPAFRGFGFGDIILEEEFKGGIDTLSCGDRPNVPGIVIRPDQPIDQGSIPRTGIDETNLPEHGECRERSQIDNVFDSISSTLCELETRLSDELTSEPLAQLEQNANRLCSNTFLPNSITIDDNNDLEAYRNPNNNNELIICANNVTLGNGSELELAHDGNITIIAKNNLTVNGNVTYKTGTNFTTSLVATAGGVLDIVKASELNGIYIVLPGNNRLIDPVSLSLAPGARSFTVLGSLIGTDFELPDADFNLIYDLGRFILTEPSLLNQSLDFIQSLSTGN